MRFKANMLGFLGQSAREGLFKVLNSMWKGMALNIINISWRAKGDIKNFLSIMLNR